MKSRASFTILLTVGFCALPFLRTQNEANPIEKPQAPKAQRVTPGEAASFIEKAEEQLAKLILKVNQAGWVKSTYISVDTEALEAAAFDEITAAGMALAKQAVPRRTK